MIKPPKKIKLEKDSNGLLKEESLLWAYNHAKENLINSNFTSFSQNDINISAIKEDGNIILSEHYTEEGKDKVEVIAVYDEQGQKLLN